MDFLLTERSVSGIGVDTLSLDYGPSTTFAVHYTWLEAEEPGEPEGDLAERRLDLRQRAEAGLRLRRAVSAC